MKMHWLISLWMLTSLGCMGRATLPSARLLPEGARLVDLTYDFDEKTLY
ncbi:MAG TPA: hypothetical protein VEU33_27145 [Archangium sp.]|nr:hypothetical protein [Archangium sp.]